MRRIVLLLALLPLLPSCSRARADCASSAGGECRPSLAGQTLTGEPLAEDALRGHVVVVNFWATWCPPCAAELPAIEAVHRRHRDEGVLVIGVLTADRAADQEAARFAASRRVSYPLVRSSMALERQVGLGGTLPVTYVYDRAGKLRRVFNGALDEASLEATVVGLLGS